MTPFLVCGNSIIRCYCDVTSMQVNPRSYNAGVTSYYLTSHSSLLLCEPRLCLGKAPVRPHGISSESFLVYLPDLRLGVTVAFGTSLLLASLSIQTALYQVSVRQATISLFLLLTATSRWSGLGVAIRFVGNYAPCELSPQINGMPVILKRPRKL